MCVFFHCVGVIGIVDSLNIPIFSASTTTTTHPSTKDRYLMNRLYIVTTDFSPICDMINGNELDVADIVLRERVQICFFILIFAITNLQYICYQIPNLNWVCIKIKHFEVIKKWRKKLGIDIFQHVTHFP